MFSPLSRGNQAGVHRGLIEVFFHDGFAFFDDARDPVAVLAAHLLVQAREDMFQPCDLAMRLLKWLSNAWRSFGSDAAFASFGSAFVNCFSASYVSRSSSMNAWWSVPASPCRFSAVLSK